MSAEWVGFFHRHVVPIQLQFRRGEQVELRVFTAFVLSVRDQWLLVTAAHCIAGVQENIARGFSIERCWLMDCVGLHAKDLRPVPFDWSAALPTALYDDPDNDIGLLVVHDHYRRLLVANGVEAITEQAWDVSFDDARGFLLVGIPSELARPATPVTTLTAVGLPVRQLDEPPPALKKTSAKRWYGTVRMPDGLNDIDGMSGGPVLAWRINEHGTMKYWLHAVQSAWDRTSRAIAACPTRALGHYLASVIEARD